MLIGNGKLITNDVNNPYIEDGAIYFKDGIIEKIGKTEDLRKEYPEEEFVDVKNRVIMPGLINAHTHIYSAFARGMAVSKPTRNFIEILENQWWALDKKLTVQDAKYNAFQTMIESVRNGVTTVFDHHASPFHIRESLFALAEAAKELGIRGDFCYEVSDRDGEKIADEGIRENIEFIKAYNNDEQDMIRGHFGLHASFTVSDKTMDKIKTEMEGLHAGYHVHTAEGIEDEYDSLKKYGKRVVERFQDWDILGPKTMCIHCCNVSAKEIQILRDTKTLAVHNPESNMGNAVGVTPVLKMLEEGIVLGLGTDAYTNDMFESMKVAKILQSHHHADPTVGFGESLVMQMENNPKITGAFFDKELGILKEGSYADIITLDYKPYTPLNGNTIGGHILFGMSGRLVNDTIINGKFVMKDREIVTVDEDKIFAESMKRAPEIWKEL
ncbi:MAG: putative aminohydrolase SsnA [Tissierellia bacterium]|nr:putative aminohydrolase SsnA [Tissierellia bacterium]